MGYDNLKLEKGMYRQEGMNFTQVLESLDPSENYRGTALEGTDAFQRQLKRFGIRAKGAGSSPVEKFFRTMDSAVLFPEYIARTVRQGMEENDILPAITATTTVIDAMDYRSIYSIPTDADKELKDVMEGASIPETAVKTKEHLVQLSKRGRMLVASYEAIRFQKLDLFGVMLRQIGAHIQKQQLADAVNVLNEEFAKEIEMGEISPILAERNLATVAIVGENMKHTPGIAGKLFGTLGRNGINVIACAQGASETNISFVVDSKSLRKSLNVIHDSFFLSEYQVLNLFICGVGTVGGSLVEQIRCQQQKLMMENGLKLHVVGIIDAAKAMFSREGFDLANFREELLEKGKDSSLQTIRDEIIGMNIFNSVFVDCTASADIASLYKDFLQHNISVVAANKIAASSAYENYRELKTIARQRGVKYLFETNVGAGLPIINTINDLIHSGDKILKIEAVLSGTLNYIFNKISADIPFSRTIKMAQEERYSEPDPRIDLSGKDVIRKLVILAREAGYRLEQEDVEKNLFVPNDFFEGSLEDFWKRVPSLDADFEARRQVLEKENKHWRFVAKLENGKASVGLQEVGANHPFYGLEGSNNIILLTTERYKEYPMMIQGYGAGAGVTAAGVFADIMSIANV